MKDQFKKYFFNRNGFTFVEILAVVAIMGILSAIAIAGVSRYKQKQVQNNYDSIAMSSYNGFENYLMKNGDIDYLSLNDLKEDDFVSNIIDPNSKGVDCKGYVYPNNGKFKSKDPSVIYTHVVDLCCSNYSKRYLYPGSDTKELKDCEIPDTSSDFDIPDDDSITKNTFNVSYKCDGASGVPSSSKIEEGTITLNSSSPKKNGYIFNGWKVGNEIYKEGSKYSLSSDVQFICDMIQKTNEPMYKCTAGTYLKSNATSCSDCESGYYCPGGNFYKKPEIQGRSDCPVGYKNSEVKSSKIEQCYMKVPKNQYVKNSKASSSTICQTGYSSDPKNVKYGSVSACVDITPPSISISNPTGGNWTNKSFKLTLDSNENGSGVAFWSVSWVDGIDKNATATGDSSTGWKNYSGSATNHFVTTSFSNERKDQALIRVCDKAGNCNSSSTWVRIDKTPPVAKSGEFKFTGSAADYWKLESDGCKNANSASGDNECTVYVSKKRTGGRITYTDPVTCTDSGGSGCSTKMHIWDNSGNNTKCGNYSKKTFVASCDYVGSGSESFTYHACGYFFDNVGNKGNYLCVNVAKKK